MTTKVCPRCKSHLIREVNESEVFHVSKERMHVYNSIRKGIKCLVCGYEMLGSGLNEKKDTDKKKGKD